MIAHVRGIVTGAAGSCKRWHAAGSQASRLYIVINASYTRDVDGLGVKNSLATRDRRRPRIVERKRGPRFKGVEDSGSKLAITRVTSPPGCSNCGSKKFMLELILINNG